MPHALLDPDDAPNPEEDGVMSGTPVLGAIAYPSHILFVPPVAWAAAVGVLVLVSILAGQILGGDPVRPMFGIVAGTLFAGYMAYKFKEDRFFLNRWYVTWFARPVATMFGRRERHGKLNRRWIRFYP